MKPSTNKKQIPCVYCYLLGPKALLKENEDLIRNNNNSALSIKQRANIIDYNLYKKLMSENLYPQYIKFFETFEPL